MTSIGARESSPPGRRARRRGLAVVLGSAIAVAVFAATWERPSRGPETVELQDKSREVGGLVAARIELLARGPELVLDAPWRMWVPESVAIDLFPLSPAKQIYDPFAYYAAPPHLDLEQPWFEHPNKAWRLRTNSLGLREDREVAGEKPDLRVLVTGDSHTDGVCDNAESWAHRLEALLAREQPTRTVEVLNAGKGGYGFHNYLGVLERFAELRPDVFVVGVYAGNDFLEVLGPYAYFAGAPRPRGDQAYWKAIDAAKPFAAAELPQGLLSLKYFQAHPEQVDVAVGAALGLAGDITGRCRVRGVRPIFALIPSPFALDTLRASPRLERALAELGLDLGELAESERVSDRFVAGVRALGAELVDLRPAFQAAAQPPYWKRDQHIDLAGHELVAAELFAALGTRAREQRLAFDERAARKLVGARLDGAEFERGLGFRGRANEDATIELAEHPSGRWRLRTNSLGLRMAREPAATRPDLCVLLTGDANAAGTCDVEDSIAARIERALTQTLGRTVEVLNAAHPGYAFHDDLDALDRFADLRPDVAVVLVSWDDFAESLQVWDRLAGRTEALRGRPTWMGELHCAHAHPAGTADALQALAVFAEDRDRLERALHGSAAHFGELAGRAEARGVDLLVAYVPPLVHARPEEALRLDPLALECSGLERTDIDSMSELIDRFLLHLRGLRVPALDLRARFAQSSEALHWQADGHLNLRANQIVAEELAPLLVRLAGGR